MTTPPDSAGRNDTGPTLAPPDLQAGSPCPNGCVRDMWRREPREPELLTANIDGELSCPTCWDYFGIVTAGED